MNLTKTLKNQGYDYIDGPIRNHELLQIWLKDSFQNAELYYSTIYDIFLSDQKLEVETKPSLNVDYTKKNEYQFDVGISLVDKILSTLGAGDLKLSANIKAGKKVTIGYNNATTKEVTIGAIQDYIASTEFKNSNPILLKKANHDHLFVISGLLYAKNLKVDIETDVNLDTDEIADLGKNGDGKVSFSIQNNNQLQMVSSGEHEIPVAVKADRLKFKNGRLTKTNMITDNRDIY